MCNKLSSINSVRVNPCESCVYISKQLEEKIDSASKNRAKAQADVIAKQKKRELRAKQAKERARRMREEENEENHFDVEKDETFNADDGECELKGYYIVIHKLFCDFPL